MNLLCCYGLWEVSNSGVELLKLRSAIAYLLLILATLSYSSVDSFYMPVKLVSGVHTT